MTRRVVVAAALLAIPAGIAAERVGSTPMPLLDLAAGWVMAACAATLALSGRARIGLLVAAASFAWFAGTVDTDLVWLHRALLATAVLAAPGGRLSTWRDRVAVAVAWVCALPWLAAGPATLATAAALVIARPRSWAALAFAGAIAWVPLARALAPDANDATLAAYDVAIVVSPVVLASGAIRARSHISDMIVELGHAGGAEPVRQALADAVGDPGLLLGRWSGSAGAFVDDGGQPLGEPPPGSVATTIDRDGAPLAVIVHSRSALADRRVLDAVATVARLHAESARLQADIGAHADSVRSSRRRLVGSANRQRAALGRRLDRGPARRLAALEPAVAGLPAAARLLGEAQRDLAALGSGLLPEALENGEIRVALRDLAAATPLPVEVDADGILLDRDVAATVYFVAAEGLANTLKHAGSTAVRVVLSQAGDRLRLLVSDDGVGGADPSGRGLQGLADRVQALGGSLVVESEPGAGTSLRAEIPVEV